jgi:hypothetical protein
MEIHKPVGIWIRVSTEDRAKGESPNYPENVSEWLLFDKVNKIIRLDLEKSIIRVRC